MLLLWKIKCSLEKHWRLGQISEYIQNIPQRALDELPALLNQEDASLEEDGTDDQDVDAVVWGMSIYIYVR